MDFLGDFRDQSQFIIYRSEDGQVKIDVRVENENVWLTQMAMAKLFETTKQNISLHINNILNDGELSKDSVVKESFTTAQDRKTKKTLRYSLDLMERVFLVPYSFYSGEYKRTLGDVYWTKNGLTEGKSGDKP